MSMSSMERFHRAKLPQVAVVTLAMIIASALAKRFIEA